jgi:trans-2,3-dihydro-3-hydroxyanthranilate isomerase
LTVGDPASADERGSFLVEGDTWEYAVLDVFTDTPLEGNQLAVFTAAGDVPEDLLQRTARELDLSETVFLLPPERDGDARVRIFTPDAELPFAGHPVLGTAVVLATTTGRDRVRLETGAGIVPVELARDGDRVTSGWMDQPVPTWSAFEPAEEALAALGLERAALPVEVYDNGPRHVLVACRDEQEVAALRPDLGRLGKLGRFGFSTFAGSGTRWRTRMFAPGLGVGEDPATGSAAGPLALHLARHGRTAFGVDIEVSQGLEVGRPSRLHARVEGTADAVRRVAVGGAAVLVAQGRYRLR